jgi:hypothetical protein
MTELRYVTRRDGGAPAYLRVPVPGAVGSRAERRLKGATSQTWIAGSRTARLADRLFDTQLDILPVRGSSDA